MEFNPIGNIFESVKVSGVGNEVKLDADGGNIVQRGLSYANLNHELSFRFTLNQDIKAGSYPWPLVLKVRALH